ncbi:MAG: cyclic nucleotide-binding domain-containing protein, partial [Fibrobacter sp.]|nr:cyclic nucleotide-binding domain-containing protein [Fibrobacter sp.]
LLIVRNARNRFKTRLIPKEDAPENSSMGILGSAGSVLALKLVRHIAVFYFFVFLAIFCLDYLFWFQCNKWFATPEALVSFQFTFYFAHAVITITGLRFLLPLLISKTGFSRILFILPFVLLTGSSILFFTQIFNLHSPSFWLYVVVLFFRHIAFEIAFSPVYQMFFNAIEKEKRGRAKTFLDGFVKPAAIVTSGIILINLRGNPLMIVTLVGICSIILVITVYYIRRTYARALIPDIRNHIEPHKIFEQLSGFNDIRLIKLIDDYSVSDDTDMRVISVKLLAVLGTQDALAKMVGIFEREKNNQIKELIARSLENHYSIHSRTFIEKLLQDSNPRIRANALYSLNRMYCHWKKMLKPIVLQLLFDNSIRVQIEAAYYLWQNGDQNETGNVKIFLNSLINSSNSNRKAAGLYLMGLLQVEGWEEILINNLNSTVEQVFTKSIDVILRSASTEVHFKALKIVDTLGREQIAITGKAIDSIGLILWESLVAFLPFAQNRRMVFEIVRCLRGMADTVRSSGKTWMIQGSTAETINKWILDELETVYRDAFVWWNYVKDNKGNNSAGILDNALRDNITRVCEWALNAMVLLDKKGIMIWRHNEIDIHEKNQRQDLVEIIEGTTYHRIGSLVLPLLKVESWENLAKNGKTHFKFNDHDLSLGLLYFIKSDNRWLCLCALYTLVFLSDFKVDSELKKRLVVLGNDINQQISKTARDILETSSPDEMKRSRAFEMLERVLFFKKTALFRNVSAEKLMRLAEIAHEATYGKGAIVSAQGNLSEHLYIVKNGTLKIIKSDGLTTTVLTTLESGQTYGEIGLFTQAPRSASAVAEDVCDLYIIKRSTFKKLIVEVPDIAMSLLEALSDRLRKSGEEMVELKRLSSEKCVG